MHIPRSWIRWPRTGSCQFDQQHTLRSGICRCFLRVSSESALPLLLGFICIVGACARVPQCVAQQPAAAPQQLGDEEGQQDAALSEPAVGYLNLPLGTLGGMQFWTDQHYRAGWRIQQHALTQHCRLLDPDDKRRAWGNFQHCLQQLERIARRERLPEPQGKVVVLLHGLGRTARSMQPLAEYLEEHGYETVCFSYASTRGNLLEHAKALRRVVDSLQGASSISLVGHSLGNLVVRRCLAEADEGWVEQRKLYRMVMLAPPNQGAELARRMRRDPLFRNVMGDSALQLAETWDQVEPHLATPPFEFGILAGGRETKLINNPLVDGQDDLVVSVEETKLAGARDFRIIAALHSFLPQDEAVLPLTLQFLEHGYFETAEQRQPIVAEPRGAEPQLLLNGKDLTGWAVASENFFERHGPVAIDDGAVVLSAGRPATGIVWQGEMPLNNYELTFQAKRIEGSDFFCGLTFPVGASYCTFIAGGWGGGTTGLSNINDQSAVENETTDFIQFQQNKWYTIRLRVTDTHVRVWIDDKLLSDVAREQKKFSIWWEQEPMRPLGIASWNTTSAVRNVQLIELTPP